ncbi:MAG: ABC transporter substrate-binding protein [Deltaproteobacteria bacterium]|nr:ABC transporter substrate-binding protein [Deltaproteobacteria bacterium]
MRASRTASCLLANLLLVACTASGPSWPTDGSLVVALESGPMHLDPRVATDQASARVLELVLNGLVTKDPSGNLLPDLAKSWEILDDGRRYRFHLRPGITFHDGRPFTAADIAWTFGTIVDGTVATAKRSSFILVDAVTPIDDLTVDFLLSQPHGALLVDLTAEQGITVVLEPNADYHDGAPQITRLTLREIPDSTVRVLELRKGSVQLVVNGLTPDQVPAFRDDPAFRVVETPGSNYAYLGFNLEDPLLSDVRVRRAIALALDRQALVDSLWRGLAVVTETMMPSGHWARADDLEPIERDLATARSLLDAAGYPDPDGDGPQTRLQLNYKSSTNEDSLLQAQIVQAMLAEVGIDLEIRSYEFATFYTDIKQGDFQLYSLIWTGVLDPHIYNLVLHSRSVPPDGANRNRYRNPEFDRLIDAGARLSDPAERRPFYVEAQRILAEDLPYISLYHKVNVGIMPATLDGYQNYLSGELYSLKKMRWSD